MTSVETSDLRASLEHSIDHLARVARNNVDSARFFSEILNAAVQVGGARSAWLWRPSADATWELVDAIPRESAQKRNAVGQHREVLAEVSAAGQPRIETVLSEPNDVSAIRLSESEPHIFIPIRHVDRIAGILETTHEGIAANSVPADTMTYLATLSEITADFLIQLEFRNLRASNIECQRWDQLYQQFWQSLDLNFVCSVIANDGRLLAKSDRVSVLIRRGQTYRVVSVSGLERIEPRSAAARSLELLATFVAANGRAVWFDETATNVTSESHAFDAESLRRYLHDCGSVSVGIVPLSDVSEVQDRKLPIAVIIFDKFSSLVDSEDWRNRCELLARRSAPVLCAAIERSEIPWLKLWQQLRRLPQSILNPTSVIMAGFLIAIAAAFTFIPVSFMISGTGELWPALRREVFASTSGIVDEILVAHGDEVAPGQPLVVLRDPDLETDTPRIAGEIAIANERLRGVQAARFSEGGGADPVLRARQLAVEEEELKERLKTLERQNSLIQERHAALTLRSPIAGKILTWDVAQHLSARPVERGQSLLTVGDTAGSWIVEVHVADRDVGHLLRARKESDVELNVDFMLASEPGRAFRGHVREVSLSSELDESARSHVRLVVGLDEKQIVQPRPGATVLTRIHCGRKSLGYVWLRDLIDTIRTQVLF